MVTKPTEAHTCIKISLIINMLEEYCVCNIGYSIHLCTFVGCVTISDIPICVLCAR
jgi:hypothetical protein